jgi:TetR/AcrR family transcriptional regulator
MSAVPHQQHGVSQPEGRKAIIEAAVQLFSESGYEGASMRRIAQEAGVSKANIYHHFESKQALYLAIMHTSADKLSVLIENLAEGKGDFDERLRAFARAHLEHLFQNATVVRLMTREAFSGDEQKSKVLIDQFIGGIIRRLIDIFERGQQAGVLRKDMDPGLCAMLLMGCDLFYFQSYAMLRQLPEARFALDHGDFSTEMMNVILDGMLDPGTRGEVRS